MYLQRSTWLENGPRPRPAVRAIAVPQLAVRRGVGAWQFSTDYCQSGWSLLNPLAYLGGCAGSDIADVYQKIQYGTPPPPVVAPPASTVKLVTGPAAAADPNAVYAGKDSSGADYYAVGSTPAENMAAAVAAQNAAIDAAKAAGYNPAGNLPINAIDLDNFWQRYGTAVLVAGAGLGGLLLLSAVKR